MAGSRRWKVGPKNDGRWKIGLKIDGRWEVGLMGGGRWIIKIDGKWDVDPQNRWDAYFHKEVEEVFIQ